MFDRILVPLDGTAPGESILRPLRRMTTARDAVWLYHVLRSVPSTDEELALAHDALAEVRTRHDLPGAHVIVGVGRPADQILLQSLELKADLIAMTSHGGGALRELVLGGVSAPVLRRSACPVLLARPGIEGPDRPVRRLLVLLEEFPPPPRTLDTVAALARDLGAEVDLLHVEVLRAVYVDAAGWMPAVAPVPEPESPLTDVARALSARDIATRIVVAEGDPFLEVARAADSLSADLIVMSGHARSLMGELLAGGTWRRVLKSVRRPVLVLPT